MDKFQHPKWISVRKINLLMLLFMLQQHFMLAKVIFDVARPNRRTSLTIMGN